jgi:hypothetical protein
MSATTSNAGPLGVASAGNNDNTENYMMTARRNAAAAQRDRRRWGRIARAWVAVSIADHRRPAKRRSASLGGSRVGAPQTSTRAVLAAKQITETLPVAPMSRWRRLLAVAAPTPRGHAVAS